MIPANVHPHDLSPEAFRPAVFQALQQRGAVLVPRAFDATVAGFEDLARLIPRPISYRGGDSLREELGQQTYTASHYPSFMSLPAHHERTYCDDVPALISFGCVRKAHTGGQTPICDGQAMLEDLPLELVQKIKDKGLLYIRRLEAEDNAFFRGWKNTFATEDREVALERSQVGGNTSRWVGDVLEVSNRRSGIITHPRTGREVWINQITSYHPSVAEYVLRITPESFLASAGVSLEEAPAIQTDCCFGDGSPFHREDMLAIWEAYERHTTLADLEAGDFLLLDNFWVGHGRRPFEGERLICVRMGNF